MKKIRKGFTLVEVICVLTIIAIIAAIAVPNISGYIEKSKINNCRSIMTDFVNDLEYKIVSKRYYDINELNDELVKYVKNSSAVEPEIESKETDNSRTTSVKAKICPNDGTYELSWTISPNIDSKSGETDIYTAKVNVSECVCKCVGTGENAVVHTGHEFTAALVASEYIDSGKTPEQKYEEIINIIIENVEKSGAGTGDLAGIVNEVEGKNPGYEIAGLTTTLDKKVEWISVYYHDTFSAEESKYKFLTRSEGKLIVKDLTETEFNDKSNWPSAEGTCGSAVYKEGWNATCYVGGLNDRDANNQEIGWIQRDGNWYVQKSNNVKGIDFTVDENSNLSGYPLISDDGCKLNNDKNLLIQTKSSANVSDIKNALQVTAEYKNGNKVIFDHISATDLTKEDYFIKNGFIIVSSESDVSWAGIYENSTSAGSEKKTLQSLLDNEDEIIEEFLNGTRTELIIAYQEYFKTYNSETKEYTRTPVTCFGKLFRNSNAETGNAEIKNDEGEVIFTIEETQNDGYEINYNQSPESNNMFRVEDLSVKRTVTYVVKDTNGNTVYSFKGSGVDVKHVEENDNSGSLGFYVGNYNGYSKDNENECIANVNKGNGGAWLFLDDPSRDYNQWKPICSIDTYSGNGYSWSYEKGENDTEFYIDKIRVSLSYPIGLAGLNGATAEGSGRVVCIFNHRTDETSEGFYICEEGETWNSAKETELISKINFRSSKANLKVHKKYYQNSQFYYNDDQIGVINNYLNSVKADYTNDGSAFSFDKLTASAGYIIEFKDYDGADPHEQINHFISLNHDDNSDNRYYMAEYNCNDDWNENNDVKNNEQSAITEILNKTECTAYVVFCDKRTRCDDIYINVTSSINPPDVVYIPDSEGSTDAHMIAYIGTNQNVTVPASHTGYWSLSEPASGVEYVGIQASGLPTYYYIDDGKTYNIKRIGADSSALPQNNEDSIKIKFPSNFKVQSIDISEGVEEIGPYAFYNLAMYDSNGTIKIADSVETIGIRAFANCGNLRKLELGTVTVNNGEYISSSKLRTIGASAFQNCNSLTETYLVVIPEGVTSIGDNAFSNFRLANATLVLNGVSEYREKNTSTSTFTENNVNSAKALTVNGVDYEGVITKKIFGDGDQITVNTLVIGGNAERIDTGAFQGVNFNKLNDSSNLIIGGNVETIGASAFQGTNFASGLVIGDKVKYIEASAFEGCSTYSGNLNLNNVVKIGQNAFKGCTNITGGLVIPETVEFIGQYAFDSFASNHSFDIVNNECKVGELVIRGGSSNQGHTLGGLIFTNAKFNNVRIEGNKIIEISAYAFKNSPIDSKTPYNNIKGALEISSSVTNIGKSAFENCTGFNGSLILPEGLTVINDATFNGCLGFTGDLTIPSSVTQIGSRAFMGCVGMNGSLTLSNNLKKIGMEAFKDCINFGNGLKIPETVTDGIGNCAFQQFAKNTSNPGLLEINAGSYSNGTKLGSFLFTEAKFNGIKVGGIVQEISANAFHHEQSDELDLNYYDPDDPDNKSTTSSGGETTTEFSLSKTTLRADYSGITGSLELEAVVTTVGEHAFYGCKGINGTISLSKVTSIGSHAFEDCSNLTGIANLNSVHTIGDSAFEDCSRISGDLSFPSTLTSIGNRAFYNGSSIGRVSIPKSVTSIGSSAFENSGSGSSLVIYGCSGKETVDGKEVGVFGDGITNSIFRNAHYSNITIGGSVKIIKENAFRYGGRLSGKLVISGEVQEIQKMAFDTCENLTGLSLDNGHIQKICEGAFARCKRVEGGLYIPSTVTYMERCAFKQFAELTPDDKIGELRVYGSSDSKGNLGDPASDDDGAPLFPSSKFKNVIIGKNVKYISHDQFNNSLYYDFSSLTGDEAVIVDGEISDKPYGEKSINYNFSGITGDLTIEEGVETIGDHSFSATRFDSVNIPKTVNNIGFMAFRYSGTGNGSLTILGSSESDGTLGGENSYIFLGAKYKGVTIGGSATKIGKDFMHNLDKYKDSQGGMIRAKENVIFTYYIGENKVTETKELSHNIKYSDITGNLTIQDEVISIGQSAFESCNFDGRLLLGVNAGSVKLDTIDKYAFKNCNNFTGDLVVPHTINSMGEGSFHGFAANSSNPGALILWAGSSDNGKTIDHEIFVGSKFHNVKIDGKVNKIAENAFININNDSSRLYDKVTGTLSLAPGVTEIGANAFQNCVFDGELLISDQSDIADENKKPVSELPKVSIGANAFSGCKKFYTNNPNSFEIPETVTSIGNEAFNSFASDNAPGGGPSLIIHGGSDGTTLKKDIFQYSRFHNVTIGGNVKTIDAEAFKSDYKVYDGLTGDLTIEKDTVEIIKSGAFKNAAGFNGKLELGSVKTIEDNAFYNCVNFSGGLNIPYGMNGIGTDAFYRFARETKDPGLFDLWSGTRVENNLQYLSGQPFRGAQFKDMKIHGSVNVIDNDAFNSYNITDGDDFRNFTGSLIFTSETEIGSWAFCCDTGFDGELLFKTDSDGKGVSKIGEGAFSGCTNFYTNYKTSDGSQAVFTIPETVTEIKKDAFDSMCSGITDFNKIPKLKILGASLTAADSNGNIEKAFGSTGPWNSSTQKYDTINIFKNAKFNNVYIGGQVQSIAERAFDNSDGDYNGITGDIEINVKNIWEKAFYKMESVDENYRGKLILDEGVEQIGPYAFAETRFFGSVTGERSFVIPGSVKSIGNCAFQYFCSGFGNPPSLTVRGYASANVENKGNGYKKSDNKNYCDIFEYSFFNNVTFEGNVAIIGTGAFNNSGGQYNGWTGTYTFYAGGLVRLYDGCFVGHNFSNVNLAKSIKHGNFDLISWASWDKSNVFGTDKNISTF